MVGRTQSPAHLLPRNQLVLHSHSILACFQGAQGMVMGNMIA